MICNWTTLMIQTVCVLRYQSLLWMFYGWHISFRQKTFAIFFGDEIGLWNENVFPFLNVQIDCRWKHSLTWGASDGWTWATTRSRLCRTSHSEASIWNICFSTETETSSLVQRASPVWNLQVIIFSNHFIETHLKRTCSLLSKFEPAVEALAKQEFCCSDRFAFW